MMKRLKALFSRTTTNTHRFSLKEIDALDPMTQQLIRNAIDSDSKTVEDVMLNRSSAVSIHKDSSLSELLALFNQHKHSRYPVLDHNEKAIGIILIKDIITLDPNQHNTQTVEQYTRQTIFTPETQKINSLFMQLKNSRRHMAIVIDEYGQYCGVVTIEQLLESLVGNIEDEHDVTESDQITTLSANQYIVKGSIPIEQINDKFNIALDTTMFDTLSGILTHKAGKIPEEGDEIKVNHLTFRVLDSDSKVIQKIRITATSLGA